MKLVPKLTLAFVALVACVLSLTAVRRVGRESELFRGDRERYVRVIGRAMADGVVSAWRSGGASAARAMVDHAGAIDTTMRIRWVCEEGAEGARPDAPGVDCGSLAALDPNEARREIVNGRRYEYVPVAIDALRRGAIEVSTSLAPEEGFVRHTVRDAAATILVVSAIFFATAWLLGFFFVARPTRALVAKARRVGRGDFDEPLVLKQRDEFGDLGKEMNAMCAQLADVHAKMKAESAARVSAMEQLRHADRLTTVGKLASGIAHELGTPLNVIEARASMIASGEAEGGQAREYAQIVVEATERMTRIIRQLLAFARRRGPDKTESDVVEMARHAAELLSPLAKKRGVDLRVTAPEARALASTDTMQLEQALTNLVVNAIHASDRGKTVDIRVQEERARPPIDVEGAEGEYLCVHVADEGAGIAPEIAEHVFEPFFTTKDVGEGTGLGLSVAYGIVRDHGGWIAVESEVGRGSRFSIYLPLPRDVNQKEWATT